MKKHDRVNKTGNKAEGSKCVKKKKRKEPNFVKSSLCNLITMRHRANPLIFLNFSLFIYRTDPSVSLRPQVTVKTHEIFVRVYYKP